MSKTPNLLANSLALSDQHLLASFTLGKHLLQLLVFPFRRLNLHLSLHHLIKQIRRPCRRRALPTQPVRRLRTHDRLECRQLLLAGLNRAFRARNDLLVEGNVLRCLEYGICISRSMYPESQLLE